MAARVSSQVSTTPLPAAGHSVMNSVALFSLDQHSLKSNNVAIKFKSNLSTIKLCTGGEESWTCWSGFGL